MFNFLVTGHIITEPRGTLTMGRDRVFTHTEQELKDRFAPGGVLDQAALMSLPTLFSNESNWDEDRDVQVRSGIITKIRSRGQEYEVDYILDHEVPPIPDSRIKRMASRLRISVKPPKGFGEFQTNHWAIKDVDLFRELFIAGNGRIKPTVFNLPSGPVELDLVGVMMPFDAASNQVHAALQAAVAAAGMRCARADDIWVDDVIINDVVKLIGNSRVVICDLSGKNANVFYEAGIAHTLGKDVILIAQHDTDVPFDLRHIRYIRYLNNAQGLADLVPKITSRLQELALKRTS